MKSRTAAQKKKNAQGISLVRSVLEQKAAEREAKEATRRGSDLQVSRMATDQEADTDQG